MTVRSQPIARSHVRPTRRAAVLVIVVAMFAVASVAPIREYLAQRAEMQQLERRTAALERTNDSLRADIHRLHDPDYLERLARACLGMVKPGEIAFVSKASGTDPAC